jgi:hypothetical protein
MTIKEIEQNIVNGDGKWAPKDDFVFTQEEGDETIHVKCARENEVGSGFLMSHGNGDFGQFHIMGGFSLKDINKHNNFCQMLIDILDVPVSIGSVVSKEVKVTDQKILGMVEAYEKLLLGREMTLGK